MQKNKSNFKSPEIPKNHVNLVFSAIEWTTCELRTNLTFLNYLESSWSTNLSTELAKLGQCLFVFCNLTNIMAVSGERRGMEIPAMEGKARGRETSVKQRIVTRAETEILMELWHIWYQFFFSQYGSSCGS